MRTYGQYCPISRASEILAERWTPLVIRNLLLGCSSFNAIAGGLPGMSRSLLSSRLKALETSGIVRSEARAGRRGKHYELTEAGRELWAVIEPMAAWGRKWVGLQPEHTDPSFVLWAWVHVHMRAELLPESRTVVLFEFPEMSPAYRRFWFLIEQKQVELCYSSPGYPHDLHVIADSEAFTLWHVGRLRWGEALRSGKIEVQGPTKLGRQLPRWNERAVA